MPIFYYFVMKVRNMEIDRGDDVAQALRDSVISFVNKLYNAIYTWLIQNYYMKRKQVHQNHDSINDLNMCRVQVLDQFMV